MQPPISETLANLIEELAQTRGDSPAVSFQGHTLTFAQFRDASIAFAKALHRDGVRKDDKVGLLMGNRLEWLVVAFATQQLGAVLVPMNTWYTARELEYVLNDGDVTVLITVDRFLKTDYVELLRSFGPLQGRFPSLRTVVMLGGGQPEGVVSYNRYLQAGAMESDSTIAVARDLVRSDDTAFILYTSGSTSRPKGVMLAHRGLIQNPFAIGERLHFDADDVLFLPVSLFWGMGCENALPASWTHGMHVVLQDHFDPDEALELIERHGCTAIYGTPNVIDPIAETAQKSERDLSRMRKGIAPGAPADIKRVIETFLPSAVNCFGLTETYGFCAVGDASDPIDKRYGTHGRPLEAADMRIFSTVTDEELPLGSVGEIRMRNNVLVGYYNAPDATSAAFDSNGYFRTGDLGLIDTDGYFHFRGRLKEMIKTGGMNVAPPEVEEVVSELAGVAAVFVTGLPDEQRGEMVVAVVVTKEGAQVTAEEVVEHCRSSLAAYKVPRRIRFASSGEIPLTTTGKLHRDRLSELFD